MIYLTCIHSCSELFSPVHHVIHRCSKLCPDQMNGVTQFDLGRAGCLTISAGGEGDLFGGVTASPYVSICCGVYKRSQPMGRISELLITMSALVLGFR